MEIIGKLIKILPEQRGESARGPWVRGGFVIETEEQFPRQVCFTLMGEERVAAIQSVNMGESIKVSFSPESREYNERWYTDLRCFRIEKFSAVTNEQSVGQPNYAPNQPTYPVNPIVYRDDNNTSAENTQTEEGTFNNQKPTEDDDLPF
jgi:hypothetical protein